MNPGKMLGLVAVAALVLTATIGVGAASAAKFHTSAAGASLSGEQIGTHTLTIGGNSVSCSSVTFSGSFEGVENGNKTTYTQKIYPSYFGCTAFGFIGATVSTNGPCYYRLDAIGSSMDLANCAFGAMTIHVSAFFGTTTCHVAIPSQNGINGTVIPTGKSTDTEMTIEQSSNNIDYEVLTDKGVCPFEKAGQTGSNGAYSGSTKIRATFGANLWKE